MANNLQIEETAAAWLAKRDRGDWTDADHAAFEQWRLASIAHHVAFARLEAVWQQTNHLRTLNAGVVPGVIPLPEDWRLSLRYKHPTSADITAAGTHGNPGGEPDSRTGKARK
jgi:transmembrane sensor